MGRRFTAATQHDFSRVTEEADVSIVLAQL